MNNKKNKNNKSGDAPGNISRPSKNNEYNSAPSNRFYTAKEEVTLRFYQVPKTLFNNTIYKGLSLGPKLMYSILRDRLDLSIKNDWKDEKGYIYLIFSVVELSNILDAGVRSIIRYKKILIDYKLIYEKRMGQGKPNWIYVLKPELTKNQKCQNGISGDANKTHLEVSISHSIDTNVNQTDLNNVNRAINKEPVDKLVDINDIKNKIRNSLKDEKDKITEYSRSKRRSAEKERLAKEISEELGDGHSLGAFRTIVDKIPEQQIRIFFSIIKDTYLTGKIKRNKGAMFITLARAYAKKNNINLNFN